MDRRVVLVPFDASPVARAALRGACLTARQDGATVLALYVVRIPRQLPLSAALPGLSRELAAVRWCAERIGHDSGVAVWVDWIYAREVAPAIADVAAELEVTEILLGIRERHRLPGWLRPWSLSVRLPRLARCPVEVRAFPMEEARPEQRPATVAP